MHGWRTWLSDLQQLLVHGDDAVLVTVARTEGAAPREVGVKMVVARDRTFHTIGGGALEWRAIEFARRLLRDGGHATAGAPGITRRLARMSLGEYGDAQAAAGQSQHTHGFSIDSGHAAAAVHHIPAGTMTLAFERLTIADLAWVTLLGKRFAAGESSVRTVCFADDSPVLLSEAPPNTKHADCLLWDAGPLMTETLVREVFPVMVFGAGHVGSALVRVLATLPCEISWIDDRPAQFAARGGDTLPPNVTPIVSADPPAYVAHAPAGCSFVIATYSETLDQHIVESVLQRGEFDYVGVIGSHTKRHSMDQFLRARGIPPAQLRKLHCPIGMEGLPGGAPEIIAISIAAQLLQHRALMLRPDGALDHAAQRDDWHATEGTPPAVAMHGVVSSYPVNTRLPDGTTVTTITTVTTSTPAAAQTAPSDAFGPSTAPTVDAASTLSTSLSSPPAYVDWKSP